MFWTVAVESIVFLCLLGLALVFSLAVLGLLASLTTWFVDRLIGSSSAGSTTSSSPSSSTTGHSQESVIALADLTAVAQDLMPEIQVSSETWADLPTETKLMVWELTNLDLSMEQTMSLEDLMTQTRWYRMGPTGHQLTETPPNPT